MSSLSLRSLHRSNSSRLLLNQQVNLAPSPQSSHLLYQFKVKVFCGLHSPAGLYRVYHLVLLLIIFVNCFLINLVMDFQQSSSQQTPLVLVMAFMDLILVVIFTVELALRVFGANCIEDYHGLCGIVRYFREYKCSRLCDLFCTAILLSFVCMHSKATGDVRVQGNFRILHLLVTFQFYRIFSKVFLNFANVVSENIRLILMSMCLYMLALILVSYIVYLVESPSNPQINSILDSAWFGFVSLATIGYGDVIINSPVAKVLTALLVVSGFCFFSLPASIVGSALAMRLQEKRQKILCLHPAANLLQKTWRFYAIHRVANYWPRFVLKPAREASEEHENLSSREKYVIYFICKVSFLLAQNRFKYVNLVYTTGSVPMQYVDLQRKIELINALVRKNKAKIETLNEELNRMFSNLLERKLYLKQRLTGFHAKMSK